MTDRLGSSNGFPGKRQVCRAYRTRDFFAIGEAKERLGEIGRVLYAWTGTIFEWYRRIRDGTIVRGEFQEEMSSVREPGESLLAEGTMHTGSFAGKCRAILYHLDPLGTFVDHPEVEPTHNLAEQMLRLAVLWRKMSLGTPSERGVRYGERALTIDLATARSKRHQIPARSLPVLSTKHPPSIAHRVNAYRPCRLHR